MALLDVRVASVQIVTGFPAHVIIPEPPGWQPMCEMGPLPTQMILTQCSAFNEKRTIKPEDNSNHALNIGNTFAAESASSADEPIDLCQARRSVSPTPGLLPTASQLESANMGIQTFRNRKLNNEQKYINFMVQRGSWIDQPPPLPNFDSCKDGPTFYVNEVIDKNVSQIWQRTADGWVSVKEGHTVITARERVLALDKHQIPHLKAVTHRRGCNAGS